MCLALRVTLEPFHLPETSRVVRLELPNPFHRTQILELFIRGLPQCVSHHNIT